MQAAGTSEMGTNGKKSGTMRQIRVTLAAHSVLALFHHGPAGNRTAGEMVW